MNVIGPLLSEHSIVPKKKPSPPMAHNNTTLKEIRSITSFDISGCITNTGLPLDASIQILIAKSFSKI